MWLDRRERPVGEQIAEEELKRLAVYHSLYGTTVLDLRYARSQGFSIEMCLRVGSDGTRKRMLLELRDVAPLDGPLRLFEGFDDFYLIDLCKRDPNRAIGRFEIHAFRDDDRFCFAFSEYQLTEYEEEAEPGATDNPDDAQRLREDH
jgi:hypothetical protein